MEALIYDNGIITEHKLYVIACIIHMVCFPNMDGAFPV